MVQIKANQSNLLQRAQKAIGAVCPPLGLEEKNHGWLERRELWVMAAEPLQAAFPFAWSFVAVRSTVKRKGKAPGTEKGYFLSSISAAEQSSRRRLELIGGH